MLEQDEEVYRFLERSVVGELLHDIYLENREVLQIDQEEGTLTPNAEKWAGILPSVGVSFDF